MTTAQSRDNLNLDFLGIAIAVTVIAGYVSLTPLGVSGAQYTSFLTWQQVFQTPPVLPDILSNLFLFVPFTFCWLLFLSGLAQRGPVKIPAISTVIAALTYSVLLESSQLVLPGRIASPWDVIAHLCGSVAGVCCWLLLTERSVKKSLKAALRLVSASVLLPACYLGALVFVFLLFGSGNGVYALSTIRSVEELFTTVSITPSIPFSDNLLLVNVLLKVVLFSLLGILSGLVIRAVSRSRVALLVPVANLTLCVLIEVTQITDYSRTASISDIILYLLALSFGEALAFALLPFAGRRPGITPLKVKL